MSGAGSGQLDLDLAAGHAKPPVDPDSAVVGIREHDQVADPEFAKPGQARAMHQSRCQSSPSRPAMVSTPETAQARPIGEKAQTAMQLTVHEGAEPATESDLRLLRRALIGRCV